MPVMRGPEGGRHKKIQEVLQTVATIRCQRNIQAKREKSIVVFAGKWRIGEDLLPRNMTVTVEPNGGEFFPAYCAGGLGAFHKKNLMSKISIKHFHKNICSTVLLKLVIKQLNDQGPSM